MHSHSAPHTGLTPPFLKKSSTKTTDSFFRRFGSEHQDFPEFSNIPKTKIPKMTPNQQFMIRNSWIIWGFYDAWGMFPMKLPYMTVVSRWIQLFFFRTPKRNMGNTMQANINNVKLSPKQEAKSKTKWSQIGSSLREKQKTPSWNPKANQFKRGIFGDFPPFPM